MDLETVRAHFPALQDGAARFDGPGGSLVPTSVARAVADAMTGGLCQRGDLTEPMRRTEATVTGARAAIGDLAGQRPARRGLRPVDDRDHLRRRPHPRPGLGPGRRGGGQPARPRRQHPALGGRRRAGRCDGALARLRPGHRRGRRPRPAALRAHPAGRRHLRPATWSAPAPTSPPSPPRPTPSAP